MLQPTVAPPHTVSLSYESDLEHPKYFLHSRESGKYAVSVVDSLVIG